MSMEVIGSLAQQIANHGLATSICLIGGPGPVESDSTGCNAGRCVSQLDKSYMRLVF